MRAAIALATMLCALGCSRDERSEPSPATAAPRIAAEPASPHTVASDWSEKRALGSAAAANPFASPAPPPVRRTAERQQQPAANPVPAPPPFAYVGKVMRGRILYAVMARADRVFVVTGNDTLDAYRVQSVRENEVVLVASGTGDAFALPFSPTSNTSVALPLSAAPGLDDASLQVSAPSRVSIGEDFTLTVSLESGVNVVLEAGRVEVRFDPKVLQIPGQSASSGVARLDIAGAYAGHAMPATLQFRVVATSPTATEIRVVPTSIADTEGRDVGVNTPQPHKLTIVGAAARGG
jgi:hypothetical protein